MEPVYREFGRRLRDARKERGLSQAYVAEYVGLSRTSITNIERGRQRMPLHVAYLLAEAVRSEPSMLLPEGLSAALVPERDLRGLEEPVKEWVSRVMEDEPTKEGVQ